MAADVTQTLNVYPPKIAPEFLKYRIPKGESKVFQASIFKGDLVVLGTVSHKKKITRRADTFGLQQKIKHHAENLDCKKGDANSCCHQFQLPNFKALCNSNQDPLPCMIIRIHCAQQMANPFTGSMLQSISSYAQTCCTSKSWPVSQCRSAPRPCKSPVSHLEDAEDIERTERTLTNHPQFSCKHIGPKICRTCCSTLQPELFCCKCFELYTLFQTGQLDSCNRSFHGRRDLFKVCKEIGNGKVKEKGRQSILKLAINTENLPS